jgi:hypothetical protein
MDMLTYNAIPRRSTRLIPGGKMGTQRIWRKLADASACEVLLVIGSPTPIICDGENWYAPNVIGFAPNEGIRSVVKPAVAISADISRSDSRGRRRLNSRAIAPRAALLGVGGGLNARALASPAT